MSRKVLFISYNGMTDPLGQSQVLPYLAQLSKNGYIITILSVEKKGRMEKEGAAIQKIMEHHNLKWHPLIFHNSLPFLSKMYDRFVLMKTACQLFRKERYSLVHCRSYVSAEVGLRLKQKMGAKFIFDMRGFWADEKKDSGYWRIDNPLYNLVYRYYKGLESKLLLKADSVVVLTHAAKEEIRKWQLGQDIYSKIRVIPCCADLSHFSEAQVDYNLKERLHKELNLNNAKPVISYLGSIGEAYAIREMLYFFDQLKVKYPAAKFLFLTKDAPNLIYNRLDNYPNISANDIVVRYVRRHEIPTYLALSTFSIFFYVPTYSRIACSPTKFAEISGLGVPVICNAVGDLNDRYLQGLPHLVIKDLENKTIASSIGSIENFFNTDRKAIRDFVLERYNLNDGVVKYLSIYQTLTS